MRGHYWKRGAVARYENGVHVQVVESGEAWYEGDVFHCAPAKGARPAHIDPAAVVACADRVFGVVPQGVAVERLVIVDGASEQRYEGRSWAERTRRIHAAFTAGRERMLLDTADFDIASFGPLLELLSAAGPERPSPGSLVLEPRVAAALLPLLFTFGIVRCEQAEGGVDGCGERIVAVGDARPHWPNVWRPSYRVPPAHAPHNLTAVETEPCETAGLPRAVALLSPPRIDRVRLLVHDGVEAWPTVVRIGTVRACAGSAEWYPFEAGSFGAEMVL